MRGLLRFKHVIGLYLGLIGLLPSCLPIPQVKLELELADLEVIHPVNLIRTEYVVIPGYQEEHTPDIYNKAYYERYYISKTSTNTILVLMPGIYGGAGSLDLLARQLVSSNDGLEVWAIDRRANIFEDRSVMKKSIRTSNPYLAFDYYVKNYKTPEGFNPVPPKDIAFMGYWGLEVHLRDLHEVILKAQEQAPRVLLGGHSLGAAISGFYTAFDFGQGKTDPGYKHISGLVLLDGGLGRTGGFDIKLESLGLGPLELFSGVKGLEEGKDSPYLTFALNPKMFVRRDVLILLGYLKPKELAPEGLYPFPLTNLAALGLSEDDQYSSSTVFSSSWGQVFNAETAGNLTAVILGGVEGVRSQSVTGVAKGASFVDWDQGDLSRERSNIAEVAKSSSLIDTNTTEWYFPIRLALDMGSLNVRLDNAKGYIPTSQVTTPTLAIGAGRGLAPDARSFAAYQNARPGSAFSTYNLPGLTHFDIVQTANNPVARLFNLWLEQLN